MVCDLDGVRCALFLGPGTLMAVEVATGRKLWSYPHGDTVHPVADPVVLEETVFITLPYSCSLLEMASDSARVLWSSSEMTTWLPPPVLVNGYIYGTHLPRSLSLSTWGGIQAKPLPFRCVDLRTGEVMWERAMKYVSLIAADGKLITLELNGTLRIADASPLFYHELGSVDVLQSAKRPRIFATPPVLCNGKIYCRNFAGDLICIDVRKR